MGRGQELLDAARKGDKKTVEKILGQITKRSGPFTSLRRGAGVNVQDDNGYTPLHHACLHGQKEIVRLLLSVDASPCIGDKKGTTPLHLAAWKGDVEVVSMLLAHNNPPANVDQLTSDDETALLMAAQFDYVEVVSRLLAKGADINIRNKKDESALDLAAQYGRLKTVQHLLRVRPQLVAPYKPRQGRIFSSTPLHRASKNGHKDVVLVLIAAGVDPNIRTHNGTPLHEAAYYGKASVVRILLEKGADLNAVDRRGKTVHDLLADYSEEATKRVKRVIREFENKMRNACESEDDLPPFPVHDYSPTSYPNTVCAMKAPETQKNTNRNDSLISPSSSSLTKNHPQSFVKKLASKCLGLKAKFSSAPNISSSIESEVAVKMKHSDHKTNTLLIGNSKFFKRLSKKEDSGEIVCNDEFDTISLDRLGVLNRDCVVNRSNRSCPGFKTSLPHISENNELTDSNDSIPKSIIVTELNSKGNDSSAISLTQAVNSDVKQNIFEPRETPKEASVSSMVSGKSAISLNECYESYEFSKHNKEIITDNKSNSTPKPPPRSTVAVHTSRNESTIYENVVVEYNNIRPIPAARVHVPVKNQSEEVTTKCLYENVFLDPKTTQPQPPTRNIIPQRNNLSVSDQDSSPSLSRTSTMSSDSMIDETNLEDILLSEKSRSFRHRKKLTNQPSNASKSVVSRTSSNSSEITEVSAIENVDCSDDIVAEPMYLPMTGTLPNKKPERTTKKKVLFRHKTFTNIEIDCNSTKNTNMFKWDSDFMKETLPNYHIRGTGHCINKAPTVQEFIYVFNRETLYGGAEQPFTTVPNTKRDSYYETAICFCKPRPPKHHKSAEDLLEISSQIKEEKVLIVMDPPEKRREILSSSFRCFCDSGTCTLHAKNRDYTNNMVVKFSAIKKSISSPDISLEPSSSALRSSGLPKNKSIPSNLVDPYAVTTIENIIGQNKLNNGDPKIADDPRSSIYMSMSHNSTLSSSASARPYSIKDIAEVISLIEHSTLSDASLSCASESPHLPLRPSSSSEYSGKWSLQSCQSNVTVISDASFVTCEESSDDGSEATTLHSDDEISDTDTIKSGVSTTKRPWVHSDSFNFGNKSSKFKDTIIEEDSGSLKSNSNSLKLDTSSSKLESGIGSESWSSGCEEEIGVPRADGDVSLGVASLELSGVFGGVRSGSGRRRWEETEGTSEGDALSVSSAASSCAPHHLLHHLEYSKVSPTPPKKPPRRNLSVSPTHANSPSSGYSYELRTHARSQDDLDDIQATKHYLKHGRSIDQYVDGKLSYSEYEENHNSPRVVPVPNPRPSLKNRTQPVAITAMYENYVIKEQNPRRKLRRNNFQNEIEPRMNEIRVRKYSNQERSSLESLLDDQSMNSPSEYERYSDRQRVDVPLSPTHYDQPPTPDHPPPSAKQAENSIHERIRPLSQLIMEVVEEIRIRKKSQADISDNNNS